MTREQNLNLLGPTIRHMPILDDAGRPVDMLSWVDMWRLPVTEPSLAGNEMKYVSDCISTVWISSQGGYINKFQDSFSEFMGGGFAQCTSSGTTALHLALRALDIGQGDEVIVPDVTFGATANVVVHAGATPIFVDIDPLTWTMDPKAFASAVTEKTKAVIPVHLYGHPCDMDPIMETARLHNIKVIEDCAESLGAEYKGQKVGLIGDVGCFSFFANKVITTGEGGMTLTKDAALHERMALLRDHGMSKTRRYWHLEAGFNYRMTNLQAALGLAQMERIDHFLEARRNVVNHYNKNLSQLPGITTPLEADWARNIYWLYSIEIDPVAACIDRDHLAIKLMEAGVETRPVFPPLHVQPAYGSGKYGTHPVAERFAERGMSLPTSNALTVAEAEKVCQALTKILKDEQSLKTIRNVI
jgi:perosamine synthetase